MSLNKISIKTVFLKEMRCGEFDTAGMLSVGARVEVALEAEEFHP